MPFASAALLNSNIAGIDSARIENNGAKNKEAHSSNDPMHVASSNSLNSSEVDIGNAGNQKDGGV